MPDSIATDAIRRATLSSIERERLQQLLFLQTLRDAAILAGEQIQDVRLDLLENPPDVALSDIFFDALVSLALGRAASFAIKKFVDSGARAIVALRGGVSRKNGAFDVTPYTSSSLAQSRRDFLDAKLEELIDPKAKIVGYWKGFASDVLLAPVDVAKKAAGRKIAEPVTLEGKKVGGDTASVAVRRAALAFSRLQELAVDRVFNVYREQTSSNTIDIDLLLDLSNYLNIYLPSIRLSVTNGKEETGNGRSNERTEIELSLFFEACIWVLHFSGPGGIVKALGEEKIVGRTRIYRQAIQERQVVLGPDRPLVKYWLYRFPHNKGNGSDSFSQHVARMGNAFPLDQALADLLAWFATIETDVMRIDTKLRALGSPAIMSVLGSVKLR